MFFFSENFALTLEAFRLVRVLRWVCSALVRTAAAERSEIEGSRVVTRRARLPFSIIAHLALAAARRDAGSALGGQQSARDTETMGASEVSPRPKR